MKLRSCTLIPLALVMLVACGSDTGGTDPGAVDPKGGAAGQGGAGSGGDAGAGGTTLIAGSSGAGGDAGAAGAGQAGAAGGPEAGAGGDAGAGGGDPAGAAGAGGDPAGAGGTAGSSGGGQAGQKSDALYCVESADCASNTGNKVCDTSTNRCVQCLPSNDECPEGQFCQLDTKTCKAGCKSDADCSADKPTCDKVFRICEQCQIDSDCPAGQLCSSGVCTSGCSDSKPCADPSQTCCDGACHALDTDVNHCGACGKVCDKPDNSEIACTQGQCSLTFCAVGFSDCNKDPSDGCEVNTAQQGACVCEPGTTAPCYDGPANTEGVGLCKGGTKTCGPSGMGYLPGCAGQVLPAPEVCADGQDHDCNGTANDVPDVDGDGWNACNGDCCEFTFQCGDPKLVNPGAYDLPGDAIDDDCSGAPDQGQPTCDVGLALADSDPIKGANAMDICQTTQAGSAKWGILQAQYVQMNGDALPSTPAAALGYGIMENFGTVVKRQLGKNMLVLSSGTARTSGQPGYQSPSGFSKNYNTGNPQGFPVNSPSCSANSGPLRDSVALKLRLKAPTNAKSVSFKFKFYTYEYPNFICSTFNDIFIAVMRDKNGNFIPGANPATGNISFDKQGNYLSVNAGFLEACTPGFHGGKQFNCPLGTTDLQGTGFETGAATDWLETIAPVNPGEEFELLFGISDAGDGILDSTVLLDAFQWLATPSSGPSTNPAK